MYVNVALECHHSNKIIQLEVITVLCGRLKLYALISSRKFTRIVLKKIKNSFTKYRFTKINYLLLIS